MTTKLVNKFIRFIYAIVISMCPVAIATGNNAESIVAWHTLKVTSDYRQQLKELQNGEYLIVWVGYTDLDLWQKLHNGNNCYVSALPGVKQGLLIGKGVNNTQLIAEHLTPSDLVSPETQERVYRTYVARLKSLTLEEQLLGTGVSEPEPVVATQREAASEQQILRNLSQSSPQVNFAVQVLSAPVQQFRAPIGHTHTCAAGHTWDHVLNPGHNCQKCGRAQYVQDPFPRPVPLR